MALACVLAMLALTISPARTRLGAAARGIAVGLGTAAKFVPLALAPLFAFYPARGRARPVVFTLALLAVLALAVIPFVPDGSLRELYDRTLGYQVSRPSPFSIWGQNSIGWLHTLVKVAAAGLALGLAFVPRERGARQTAALGAAVLIALQLAATHWFYLYIVWFLPFVLVVCLGAYRTQARDEPTRCAGARARGGARVRRLLLPALLLLVAGWAAILWIPPFSDDSVNDLYVYRTFAEPVLNGELPYRDQFFEYPPLAAPAIVLPGLLGTGEDAFRWAFAGWTFLLAAAVVVLCGALAARTGGDTRRALLAAAAMPFLCGAMLRTHFDLAPVALMLLALWLLVVERPRLGLAVLGLAVMTKGFPIVAAPVALAWLAARSGRRVALEGGLALAGTMVVVAAFAIAAVSGRLSRLGELPGRPPRAGGERARCLRLRPGRPRPRAGRRAGQPPLGWAGAPGRERRGDHAGGRDAGGDRPPLAAGGRRPG